MAHIIITDSNKEHLLGRANERFNKDEKLAFEHIERIKYVLENESPKDWRFTKRPVAKFLIHDVLTGFRILGRTYRNVGKELIQKLESLELDEKKINEIADKYLGILKNYDSDIVHELKTIYKKGEDISDVKHSYTGERRDLVQIILIDAKRVAARPNAIIEDKELWVRQEELLRIDHPDEYLLFNRLTCNGIDKSKVRVYKHDAHGNIKHEEKYDYEIDYRSVPLDHNKISSEFRTSKYWSLPTYLDACYMDLDYKREKYPTSLTEKEALLLFRIEALKEIVRRKLGLL
jgi:hypothetical protein